MLSKDQYQWVKPGEDFPWHGSPLPASDLADVQRAPTREDLAYLQEWLVDACDIRQTGIEGSYKNYVVVEKYLSSQAMTRYEPSNAKSVLKRDVYGKFFLSSLNSGYFCTRGDLSSALAPYMSWKVTALSAVMADIAPDALSVTEVSSVNPQLTGAWASQSNMNADALRTLYYDLSRLSAFACYSSPSDVGASKSYSKDVDLATLVPENWSQSYTRMNPIVAAQSGTCSYTYKRWDSSKEQFVTQDIDIMNSSTGEKLKAICTAASRMVTKSGDVYWEYAGKSTGDFGVAFSPALSGRIAEAYVIWNAHLSYQSGSSWPTLKLCKAEKLQKASPVNGKEVWACTEGTFKDMAALGDQLYAMTGHEKSAGSFSMSRGSVLLKLKDRDSKPFHFEGWDWTPSGGFSKQS